MNVMDLTEVNNTRVYGKELVVQSNRLIQAIHSMTLTEHRLFLFASPLVRHSPTIAQGQSLLIRADEFASYFGVETHTAYEVLNDAVNNLFERYFTYTDTKGNPAKSRWVYDLKYRKGEGAVEVSFPPLVVQLLTEFDKNNPFTKYEMKNIARMTSTHAIRLYELLVQYREIGHRKIRIYDLRNLFELGVGLGCKYPKVADLKKRVIDVAVDQINEHTDLVVEYTQSKVGRIIAELDFSFKEKAKKISNSTLASSKNKNEVKNISGFAGLELTLLKDIQKNHPEITERYVCNYGSQHNLMIIQVLEKIKSDYKAAEQFSLEKSD
jgi:plasmid replication initiation protein